MTPDCRPRPNGYVDQRDCVAHGTPWDDEHGCSVTEESWAAYVAKQMERRHDAEG